MPLIEKEKSAGYVGGANGITVVVFLQGMVATICNWASSGDTDIGCRIARRSHRILGGLLGASILAYSLSTRADRAVP
jgi:hypothetical protein